MIYLALSSSYTFATVQADVTKCTRYSSNKHDQFHNFGSAKVGLREFPCFRQEESDRMVFRVKNGK